MKSSFKKYLQQLFLETLEVKNGKVVYIKQSKNYASEPGLISTYERAKDSMLTTSGQDVRNKKIFSLYNYKSDSASNDIILSLKNQGPYEIDTEVYNKFLHDSATYAKKIMAYQQIDFVIYPVSSSKFLKDFVSLIENETHITFIKDAIIKKQIKNVEEYAEEMIDKDYYGYAKLTDAKKKSIIKSIINNVKKNEASGKGSIITLKNVASKRDSHYISKFMEIANDDILEVENKNVMIIDDLIGSGTSFSDMIRVVDEFAPSEIFGLTIFKRAN